MPTHHDYDADGTMRDEMLDAREVERERQSTLVAKLASMPRDDRHYLLARETMETVHELWVFAMASRQLDVAATIEVHANSRDQF